MRRNNQSERYRTTCLMDGKVFVGGADQNVIMYDGPSFFKALFQFLRAGGKGATLRRLGE